MAEKQTCREDHRICANNCGCSKCYRDLRLKEEQASSANIAAEKSLSSTSLSSFPSSSPSPSPSFTPILPESSSSSFSASLIPAAAEERIPGASNQLSRCTACRKRVGLTGFRCRCGTIYCWSHRHPEQHGCTFDFKAAGREAIARANPVVKAEKLVKI